MSQRIVLIGAGSIQFGCDTLGDIFQNETLKGSHIVLHDINPEALKKTEEKAVSFIERHQLPFSISASVGRKEALAGADFIITSIEVGDRFALWDTDWGLPQQYGIRQVYGENGGPGGLFHSLRIIPPILDICEDVQAICPEAWIFNYSNPMSRICTTVHRKFPDLNFVGLCHEIASLERFLPKFMDTPFENLNLRAGGLNHFSVLLEASRKDTGEDVYPQIRAKAPGFFANRPGYSELYKYAQDTGKLLDTESSVAWDMPDDIELMRNWSDHTLFKEVLEKFNYLPITTDSHFGEYIQWAHEVADHQGILDFYNLYRKTLGKGAPEIELIQKERVVSIIEGIINDTGYEEGAVNIPNKGGLIRNLPEWLAVEVPAKVTAKGLQGIELDMPAGIGGLLSNQVAVHDLTADAILNQSKDLVIQALLVDPVVDKCSRIPEMVEVMIDRQQPYLNYLK